MSDRDSALLRVAAARIDFLEHGRSGAAGVPDTLVASWERSRVAGVDVARPLSAFTDEIDTGSLLVHCARPVLEQLEVDIADTPLVIALTDKRARLIQRIDCSPAVARLFDRAQFAPGFDYAETTMGTNGVGTVFETGQPLSVVGPEHFTENLQTFACSGAPIIDPITGRVEGVLDISLLAQGWSPILQTLVKGAAKEISRNLLLDRGRSQQAIFDAYLRVTARSARQAVFAFGDSLVIASTAAQQMFDADEQQMLREHATFLMSHADRTSDTFTLPGSARLVRIRGIRVFVGAEVAGMVVTAEPLNPRRAAQAGRPSQISDGVFVSRQQMGNERSPAWLRACDELRKALQEQKWTLLVGEPGSGKFTLAMELFHAVHPNGRSISVDAAHLETDISAPPSGPAAPTLHLVRHIDAAEAGQAEQLQAYLSAVESLAGPQWIVATAAEPSTSSELPFRSLLDRFDAAVLVPPLRYRTDDLAAVTAALLRRIAPDRRVRLSPAAQRLITCYSWPGNITQLQEALAHALRRRPVGEIQERDLPGYCQTTSRRILTPLETAERDAIVTALQTANSNRVAAAIHLGMSRSSLYRKLKTYGITA